MEPTSELRTEQLLQEETHSVTLPHGISIAVTATHHHWLVVKELEQFFGWTLEAIAELALEESKETGNDFATCFCGIVAYIQADARHVLGATIEEHPKLPRLLSGYQARSMD